MGGLPSPSSSTHGGPRPPSTPPHGTPSSPFSVPQYPAQYGPSGQFNAQTPFETYTPSAQHVPPQSLASTWRRALAFNRSSILIGGGAGIAIIIVAILVLRVCGG